MLTYAVIEQRQNDVAEVCRSLCELIDPSQLAFACGRDGEPFDGADHHAVVTVVATGEQFRMRIVHDSENELDFHVDPTWFHGSIRYIPHNSEVRVRESFTAEWNRWCDAQWEAAHAPVAVIHGTPDFRHAA